MADQMKVRWRGDEAAEKAKVRDAREAKYGKKAKAAVAPKPAPARVSRPRKSAA